MKNTTRIHLMAHFFVASILLAIPTAARSQGLFAQAADSATKVRDAYAEIHKRFYGVGHRKNLYRAALDRRTDGTPNISVDAEAHTADVTIRLFVNDAAYNAWKADAHRRLDALVKSVGFSDFESSHDRVVGGKVYRFGDNEFSAIRKWEQGDAAKTAEIVIRCLFRDKDGKELWRCDLPLERFRRSGGRIAQPLYNLNRLADLPIDRYQMQWGDEFMEGMWKEIKGAALEPQALEDAAAVIHIKNMSDSFIANVAEIKCVVIDDETLIPERQEAARRLRERRLATRKDVVPQLIEDMVLIPNQTFRFGKYEVTQAQWEAIMGTNPVVDVRLQTGNRPIFNVSWNDCQEFLVVLNSLPEIRESGMTFRFPTRHEWELVEKEGGGYRSGWGVDWGAPEPVGTKFPPNVIGLYDINGNVSEWTSTSSGEKRIACGQSIGSTGSWHELNPDNRLMTSVGFRLCADDLTAESKRKEQAERQARDEAERKTREAAALAERLQEMRNTVVPAILADMVIIPSKDFRIGRCEVTQKQWEAIMGNNPSHHKGDNNPVEMVSWDDCQQFLTELNAVSAVKEFGLVFRLPTEEEWEYACRAGATGDFCKLDDGSEMTKWSPLGKVAWYWENSNWETQPVGQLTPNAFGLFDMLGNVGEWTQTQNEDTGVRIVRGGDCRHTLQECNAFRRGWGNPSTSNELTGFRLCADESNALHRSREKDAAEQMEQKNAERIAGEKTAAEQKAVEQAVSKACEEKLQQKRTEIAARTQGVKLPGGVRLEMVKTPDGLWFGKTEVTRAQWNAVMNAPSSSSSGGTKSRSGLQAPLLAKFAERGISDEQIAALMSANEETAEAFGQLRALFAQMESAGTASLFLDSDEFETLLHNTEVMFGAGSWNDADDGDDDDPGDASSAGNGASDFPVVNVSIVDCARFIKALNALPATKAAGLRFRLPTLSEWRKASLAGGKRPFGSTFMGDDATIRDVGWIHNDEAPGLHPVAQRQPNAWGLYDMFGNVREFVGPVPKEDDAYIRAYGGSFRTWEENLRQGDDFNDPFWYKSKADDLGLRLCAEESE